MKNLVVTLLLLIAFGSLAFAAKDPPAKQVITTAQKEADLLGERGDPFRLNVNFVADAQTGTGPVDGYFQLKWGDKDHWWRQIDLGGYRQTDIRVGKKLYTSRNAGYTPIAVREFLSLMNFARVDQKGAKLVVTDTKRCKKNGVDAVCVKGDAVNNENEHHEVALNATNGILLSDDWSSAPDHSRKEEFSNWVALDKYRYYPRKLQLTVNGDMIVSAIVTSLSIAPFDESLLNPPKDAVVSQ